MKNPTMLFDHVWIEHEKANAELKEKCRQCVNAAKIQQALAIGLANAMLGLYPHISIVTDRWGHRLFGQLVTLHDIKRLEIGEDKMPVLSTMQARYLLNTKPTG